MPTPHKRLFFQEEPSEAEKAKSALHTATELYAKHDGYRDRGTIIATMWSSDPEVTEVARFETLFLRGHGFRFRFSSEDGRPDFVIWSVKGRTLFWHLGRVSEYPSLGEALAAGVGVSKGAASTVPRLLLGQTIFARPPSSAADQVAFCDCVTAFVVETEREFSVTRELGVTIDTKLGLVRRTRKWSRYTLPGPTGEVVVTDTITVYEPQFDVQREEAIRELDVQPW